ncbi:Aste57867_19785 [Aphanomyces stellatus]|uniref:Aste57867_19785 protein n=1 Tax=Aphanomyces stellatus TaxID=120398 RepID=A0A485LDY2_9STRA|nr:hypothetical protein As57867_019720 [Aphanomyces stellatus]VFT96483.1 Aste57867_19785 [Aphanomyces stellatus]
MSTIMTVRGPVSADVIQPGILFHQRVLEKEHVAVVDMDIPIEMLMRVREHPTEMGNLVLSHEDRAFRELERAAGTSVNCVVDIHATKGRRDLARLRRLAAQLDMHILASTCLDDDDTALAGRSAEMLAKQLVLELQFGIEEGFTPPIQASVIYQTVNLAAINWTFMDAIGQAQRTTHAPVYIHLDPFPTSCASLDAVEAFLMRYATLGELDRVVVCHCDLWCRAPARLDALLQALPGVYLSFDLLGLYAVSDHLPFPSSSSQDGPPRDADIVSCLVQLLAMNPAHAVRLLVTSTVSQTIQYTRHGGGGMTHALTSGRARLAAAGVTADQWNAMTNPLSLLQCYTPPPPAELPKDYLVCSICARPFEPIVGEYFTKFAFVYCSTKCLRKHRIAGFGPLPSS